MKAFWFNISCVLAVTLLIFGVAHLYPAHVSISIANQKITFTLLSVLLFIWVCILFLWLVLKFLNMLLHGAELTLAKFVQRKHSQALRSMNIGLQHFVSGDFAKAYQAFVVACRGDTPLCSSAHLFAALTAAHIKKFDSAREHLHSPVMSRQGSCASVYVDAEIIAHTRPASDSSEFLADLLCKHPSNERVALLLQGVAARGELSGAAAAVLVRKHPADRRHATVYRAAWKKVLEKDTYFGSSRELIKAWGALPDQDKHQLAPEYIRALAARNCSEEIIKYISQLLRENVSAVLTGALLAYLDVPCFKLREKHERVQEWLREIPNHPSLLLAAGCASVQAGLYEQARHFFTASIAAEPSGQAMEEACRALNGNGAVSFVESSAAATK